MLLEKVEGKAGDSVELKDIVFVSDEDKKVVKPDALSKANVKGTIIEQAKGNKIIVYKHKAKKGYRRKRGHRQLLTKVKIDEIILGEKKSKALEKPKKTVVKKTTKAALEKKEAKEKKVQKKVASKPATKVAVKTTAKKETKKPAKSVKSSTKKSSSSKGKTASKSK